MKCVPKVFKYRIFTVHMDWSFYSQTLLSNCSLPPKGRKQGEEGVDVTSLWSPSFLFWIAAAKLCDLSRDSYNAAKSDGVCDP